MKRKTYNLKEVLEQENKHVKRRRAKLYGEEDAETIEDNRFGIALSGGGLRSSTVCLGALAILNQYGIIKRADYLSSVSGGGYTSGYVHTSLKNREFEHLFDKKFIEYLMYGCNYLAPGSGLEGLYNKILLFINYIVSLLLSWLSPLSILLMLFLLVDQIRTFLWFELSAETKEVIDIAKPYLLNLVVSITIIHLVVKLFFKRNLNISNYFVRLTAIPVFIFLLLLLISLFFQSGLFSILEPYSNLQILTGAFIVIVLGFFLDPNSLSFHYYFRSSLANTFLVFSKEDKNIPLKDLFDSRDDSPYEYQNPYPIFNTCLNFQSGGRLGSPTISDYFLLSPLYCGSLLCKYVETDKTPGYRDITVPSAMTASAAAVNPGMGVYSSGALSFFTTLFNIRLGYWVPNPLKIQRFNFAWWPFYYLYELFSKAGLKNKQINISDGGHVENLGVFELLRRKCRLIMAIDAGADPNFSFEDLQNLIRRARTELGLEIRFREGEDPEVVIRPKPTLGYYSKKRFAIADIIRLWEVMHLELEEGKAAEKIDVNFIALRKASKDLSPEDRKKVCEKIKAIRLEDYFLLKENDVEEKYQDRFEEAMEKGDPIEKILHIYLDELLFLFFNLGQMIEYQKETTNFIEFIKAFKNTSSTTPASRMSPPPINFSPLISGIPITFLGKILWRTPLDFLAFTV